MRLFIAVDPDPAARDRVAAAAAAVRRRLAGARASITWVAPERLHMTLVFLGEVVGATVEPIRRAIAVGWSQDPFSVTLASAGVFPRSGAPRVIWLGVREGGNELGTLHAGVWSRLEPLGFRPEPRAFRAHLTLGRVRRSTPDAGRVIRDALERLPPTESTWWVDRIALYESRLSASGPSYRLLETGSLGVNA